MRDDLEHIQMNIRVKIESLSGKRRRSRFHPRYTDDDDDDDDYFYHAQSLLKLLAEVPYKLDVIVILITQPHTQITPGAIPFLDAFPHFVLFLLC